MPRLAGQTVRLTPCCILSMCPDLPKTAAGRLIKLKESSGEEFVGGNGSPSGTSLGNRKRGYGGVKGNAGLSGGEQSFAPSARTTWSLGGWPPPLAQPADTTKPGESGSQ
jgi:hypothetical protein